MDKNLLMLWNEYQKLKNPNFVPEGDIQHLADGGPVDPLEARKAQVRSNLQAAGIPDDKIEMMVERSFQPSQMPAAPIGSRPMPQQMTPTNAQPLGLVPYSQTQDITNRQYSDGGEVEEDSDLVKLGKKLKEAFSGASPSPTPAPSPVESKYDKIRRENRSNFGYADGGSVKTPEELAEENAAGKLTDDTGYAQEDFNAENAALGPENQETDEEDDKLADDSDEDANKDQEADLSAPMAADNDKNVEAKRDAGTAEARKMDGMTLDKKEALAQNPPTTDPASGLQVSALQKLINATSRPQGQDLAAAQAQRDQNLALNQVQQGAAIAGAGMAHANPNEVLGVIKGQEKYAGLPVEKYNELITNQQNDPNSPMSQALKGYLESKGFKTPENASAADLLKVAPFLVKDQAAQTAMQKALMQEAGKKSRAEAHESAADKRAKDRNSLIKEGNDSKKTDKANLNQDKALQTTKQLLESARGNPAAAQAEKDLYSVQKANSLINLVDDPNKMSNQQVNLLVSEVSKIATGGVPTGHEQEALKPGTGAAKLAKLWSSLTNEPTGANAGAFIKEFQNYNNALAKDAKKVIQDKYGRVIESSKKQLGDDNYKALQSQYLHRFDEDAPAVDVDLSKLNPDQLKAYIKTHGG